MISETGARPVKSVSRNSGNIGGAQSQILIVDDDRLILSTLARGIRDAGYRVQIAASGEEALACVRAMEGEIDLAIVDISLPCISGTELAQILAEEYGIPALFLSAYSDREVVSRAVSSGGIGYLVKPVDVPHLLPSIEAAVARSRDFVGLLQHKNQLEQALKGNRDVNISIGILMERGSMSKEVAFETLRNAARSNREKIESTARKIVESEENLNLLTQRKK